MLHFAELDDNNVVKRVITVAEKDCLDSNGNISEEVGAEFCRTITAPNIGKWVITYPDGSSPRKNFAGMNDYFDEERNAFITPKTFNNWVFDEESCRWVPPVPRPNDGKIYSWSQEETCWVLL